MTGECMYEVFGPSNNFNPCTHSYNVTKKEKHFFSWGEEKSRERIGEERREKWKGNKKWKGKGKMEGKQEVEREGKRKGKGKRGKRKGKKKKEDEE